MKWRTLPRRHAIAVVLVVAVAAGALGIASAAISGGSEDVVQPRMIPGDFEDLKIVVGAIDRPRTSGDELSPIAVEAVASIASASSSLSVSASDSSMRVFEAKVIGPVWVVPAADGFGIITETGGGMVSGVLGRTMPIAGGITDPGPDDPAVVWGIATDAVIGIDIVIGDQAFEATLVENGYYWLAPDESIDLDRLEMHVHLADGAKVVL